jgi:hypothetical protein
MMVGYRGAWWRARRGVLMKRTLFAVALVLAVACGLTASAARPAHGASGKCGRPPAERQSRGLGTTPDSVALRLFSKLLVDERDICTTENWGWDSLTRRLAPGDSVANDLLDRIGAHFALGRIMTPDSAWLRYPRCRLMSLESYTEEAPVWDSVLVTSRLADFQQATATGVMGTVMWFRVRLVRPWPEPPPLARRTTVLRGRVLDDSTGRGIAHCQVVVDGTHCSAYTDTLGEFVLRGVPVGAIGVLACARGLSWEHVDVQAPVDSVIIRLPRLDTRTFH